MARPDSTGKLLGLLGSVLVLGAIVFWSLFRGPEQPPPGRLQGSGAQAPGISNGTSVFPNTLPKQGGPAGYVSSAGCKECHAKQYETWWRSYHRQMTQAMNTRSE